MDMFTPRLRWSSIQRLFSRNPLVRAVDRVEAVVMLLAAAVLLLAAPLAATAVGTAVHHSRSDLYPGHPQTRHAPPRPRHRYRTSASHQVITVAARWGISATGHHGVVKAAPIVQTGERVGIWADNDGQQVDKPTTLSCAANDAVLAALMTWSIVIAATAAVLALTRAMLDHVRNNGWRRDIDTLFCHGGGQTNTQP